MNFCDYAYHLNVVYITLKMADFLDIGPKRKTPAARKTCVDKSGSRPRGILGVPKIRAGERKRRQTYGNIANSVRKSSNVLFYSFTRPGGRKRAKTMVTSRVSQ